MTDLLVKELLKEVKCIQFTAFFKVKGDGVFLPSYQGSTFRGVFGHVFKEVACTCPQGSLHRDYCPYAYIFETHPQKGMIGTEDVPRPFIICPENNKQYYAPGERISINATLFGGAIDYLDYFLYVFYHMGERGFGKGRQKAELRQVFLVDKNGDFQDQLLKKQRMDLSKYILGGDSLLTAVENTSQLRINFITPTRLKYNSHYTDKPEFHVILRAAVRRITSLLYYHHGQQRLNIDFKELFRRAEQIKLVESDFSWYDWERYSTRQKERMKLGGIIGNTIYEGELDPFIPWLQLAEWTHIGKNTTFGLGKIKVVFE